MDRFREAIPQEWRPSADYRVLGGGELTERTIIDLVLSIPSDGSKLNEADRRGLSAKRLYWGSFLGRSLPLDTWPVRNLEDRAAAELWKHLLHGGQSSTLSFPMIGLLAELMLRTNPLILEALRKSYKYVFLDEFQDTSRVHYELTSTSFLQSTSVLTAVGDNKQRIMQWAGALDGIFDKYSKEFGARVLRLERNYRSGPELVRVQGLFARTLDPNCAEAIAMDDGSNGHGECRAFAYSSDDVEACHLARLVSSWIAQDKIVPRDICILTRLRNPAYTDKLRNTLRAQGVKSRVENEMQDLLAEPLTVVLINFIKLACSDSVPLACMRVRLSYPMSPLKPSDGIDFT
jgi:superfamily I DNA/RNA helicase